VRGFEVRQCFGTQPDDTLRGCLIDHPRSLKQDAPCHKGWRWVHALPIAQDSDLATGRLYSGMKRTRKSYRAGG
jgi:hypothetical protein